MNRKFLEQADGGKSNHPKTSYHRFLKRHKHRVERRAAKVDPECVPGYGKYRGYEL